jgi:hypothetical protein
MALHFYSKHSKEDCEHAIESMPRAGGYQRRGGATPIQAGDENTWLGGGPCCRRDPTEEDEARAHHGDERGTAIPLAKDCNGSTSPSQMEHRREPNL